MVFDHTMEVHAMLALAIIITPIVNNICAVYVNVPMINLMPVIFKTVDIRIAVIKVVDASGPPVNVWVVLTIILCPRFATVPL
jgi:hypothetical protein